MSEFTPAPPAGGQAQPLTGGERAAVAVAAALTAGLAVAGFANSFAAVAHAARPSFGPLAPTVPLAIDAGIAVFAALDIVLARLGLRPRWVPAVPWALTAATVWLNIAGQHTWFARTAHAVLPGLWIAAVSLAAHVARVRAGLAAGTALDRIRLSRWLLAPLPTARLARRMVLWEVRSYPDALRRERDRLLALTELQDTYGRLAWRWRAPRRIRALYRLGELAPAPASPGGKELPRPWPGPAPGDAPAPAPVPAGAPGTGAPAGLPAPGDAPAPGRTVPQRTRARVVTGEAAEAHFAADLAAGQVPSIRRIRRELHTGQDRAARIHAHLSGLAATANGNGRAATPELSGRTA
jgi:hypothetical protein